MSRRIVLATVTGVALFVAACAGDDGANGGAERPDLVASEGPAVTAANAPAPVGTEAESIGTTAGDPDASTDEQTESASEVDQLDDPSTVPSTAPPTSDPVDTPAAAPDRDFAAVDATIDRFVAERRLNGAGFIVVDAAEGVVHEHYAGEFSPDRISLVASSSKMVTAGVLMRLHDDGLLDIDAPVAEVVEWGAANPDITPAQLVSNSSGLVGLLPDAAYRPYRCQWLWTTTLQQCAADIFTTPDDDAEIVPPDTQFRYGGAQWQVAGAVAEVASGTSWRELIDEIYVEPCGLESFGYNNHFADIGARGFSYPDSFKGDLSTLRPTDNPNMEAGLYTTAGDYAELLLMHLRGGRCGDEQILSEAAVDRLHTDRISDLYGSAGPGTGYGMGWWVDLASGHITDAGAYGSVPWLDLDDGYGAVLVIESDVFAGSQLSGELFGPVDALMGG